MGVREYWNKNDGHYLGPAHDAIPIRIDPANPLDYGRPELDIADAEQRLGFRIGRPPRSAPCAWSIPTTRPSTARIKAYELAYRMQGSLPK